MPVRRRSAHWRLEQEAMSVGEERGDAGVSARTGL